MQVSVRGSPGVARSNTPRGAKSLNQQEMARVDDRTHGEGGYADLGAQHFVSVRGYQTSPAALVRLSGDWAGRLW